jgi:hypothetical protein
MTPQEFQRTQRKFERIFKGENGDANGDISQPPGPVVNSTVSHLADLAVEAGIMPDRTAALRYLLRTKNGTAVLQRLGPHLRTLKRSEPAREDMPKPTAKQRSDAAAKRALGRISEHEFSSYVMEHARKKYPADAPAVAFTKVYEERSDEGAAIRAARQQIKQRQFATECHKRLPFEVNTEPRESDSADGALGQLRAMATEQRKLAPYMSTAEAFRRVYENPDNAELVRAEREQRRRQLGV